MGKLVILAMLTGCVSTPPKAIDEVLNASRMPFKVKDVGEFKGVTTLQRRSNWVFEFNPKHEPREFFLWTCAGPEFFDDLKRPIKFRYVPTFNIEMDGFCPIRAVSVGKNGIVERAIIGVNNGDQLEASVECSRRTYEAVGQHICDMPANTTTASVWFKEPVKFEPAEGCDGATVRNPYRVEISTQSGLCTYTFLGVKSGQFFIFAMRGYTP